MKTYHPQVEAESKAGAVWVDREMKEILEWSWAQGVSTEYSCQGDSREKAYIMFSDSRSAELFLERVSGLSDDLRARVHSAEPYSGDDKPSWQLVAFPKDRVCGCWNHPECTTGQVKPCIRIALRLPSHELGLIKSAIKIA